MPRLAGQVTPTLVITRLVKSGTMVKVGDLISSSIRRIRSKRHGSPEAELIDLDDQIQKKRSDQAVAKAADDTVATVAEHDLARARLDMLSNDLLAKVKEVETNTLALEQAQAKLSQLKSTVAAEAEGRRRRRADHSRFAASSPSARSSTPRTTSR